MTISPPQALQPKVSPSISTHTIETPSSSTPTENGDVQELPLDLTPADWPITLTLRDRQAIWHYADVFVPRMVLKTARWSSYAYVLRICTKHPLLAHLVLAFSIRDMATDQDTKLLMASSEHHQKALAMFIEHLNAPESQGWLTFPSLWLFIHYEQQYGDNPRVLQKHLEGVRDVIASHWPAILPRSIGNLTTTNVARDIQIPPQMIDRLALWTIYHDAHASTFGFGGNLIGLLNAKYPGSIERITKSSNTALESAWGPDYPVEEELWDLRLRPVETFMHELNLLRYELSKVEEVIGPLAARMQVDFGRDLKRIEIVSIESGASIRSRTYLQGILASDISVPFYEYG